MIIQEELSSDDNDFLNDQDTVKVQVQSYLGQGKDFFNLPVLSDRNKHVVTSLLT